MVELQYKNQTSLEKRRKVITIKEESQKNGFLTLTSKRFIYLVRDNKNLRDSLIAPRFNILKIHDSQNRKERFIFRVKGSFYVVQNQRVHTVFFCHSFRIDLKQISEPAK